MRRDFHPTILAVVLALSALASAVILPAVENKQRASAPAVIVVIDGSGKIIPPTDDQLRAAARQLRFPPPAIPAQPRLVDPARPELGSVVANPNQFFLRGNAGPSGELISICDPAEAPHLP